MNDGQIKLRRQNLGLIESKLLCNMALTHKNILFDDAYTPNLINDCKFAKVDESGILIKDRKDNKNDHLDCVRYALDAEFPELIKRPPKA